jgi:hypothetical protein
MPSDQRGRLDVSTARQSINRESITSVIRVASSARRGLTWRSRYSASCFRRKRFSAANCDRDLKPTDTNLTTSTSKRTAVRHTIDRDECFRMRQPATPRPAVVLGSSFDEIEKNSSSDGIFADHSRWRRSRCPGRPRIDSPCRDLIGRLAEENRLWGAPRIHGELLKLGLVVSERTVSRYLRECPRRPSQTWRTFLANHLGQFTLISPVMSPYVSGDDVVDTAAVTSRSTPLSDRLSASSHCVPIDWRASVRRTFVGARIAQDHCRDRTGMRSGTSRAPPTNGCVRPTRRARCRSIRTSRTGPTAIIDRVRLLRVADSRSARPSS